MKFPGKVDICLNCDSNLKIIDDYNFCENCCIYYGEIIHNDPISFMILNDGLVYSVDYSDQSKNTILFDIDESKDFKEVLSRINKMIIFQ